MLSALAATGIWSISTIASARGAQHLGGVSANLVRISLALPILFLGALVLNLTPWKTLSGPGADWFVISGLMGMGICDILALQAFARLGARVPSLIINITAPLAAAAIGWIWLSEHAGLWECCALIAILVGMGLVLWPRSKVTFDTIGLLYASLSGITFAIATVMSRVGYTTAGKANLPVHWLDATILRVCAGLVFTIFAFGLTSIVFKSWRDGPGRWKKALPWLALNAVLGPSLGMACFQFALVTTKAHIVHAIVATLPIAVMIIAWASGEERPDQKGLWGTILAVLGVIALVIAVH